MTWAASILLVVLGAAVGVLAVVAVLYDAGKVAASINRQAVRPTTDTEPPAPLITRIPGVCGGKACIAGMRFPVRLLLEHRDAGDSDEWLKCAYPNLTQDHLDAAWRYAEEHPEEMVAE